MSFSLNQKIMNDKIKPVDSFLEKLLKLIPVEIVLVYATLVSFIPEEFYPHLIIFLVLLLITPLYLRYALDVNNYSQIIVSTLSFVIWVFYLGGPFTFCNWYAQWIAGTILIVFSLIPPMILKSSAQSVLNDKESHSTDSVKSWREI